jgi:ComEC/Rec2-related protein
LVKEWGGTGDIGYKNSVLFSRKQLTLLSLVESSTRLHIEEISSLVPLTDKPLKTKKALIQQGLGQDKSSKGSEKNWVLERLRVFQQEKYRLIQRTKAYTGVSGRQLIAAFVFGSVSDLKQTTKSELQTLGMLHVASASGANVSLILSLLRLFTKRLPRGWHFSCLVLCLCAYSALAEFSASIVRSALGSGYRLVGQLLVQRPVTPFWALGASAGIMLLLRPQYVSELSFQLSCLATLGLACFGTGQTQNNANVRIVPSLQLPFDLVTRERALIGGLQPQVALQSAFRVKWRTFIYSSSTKITQTLSDSLFTSLAAQVFVTPFIWLQLGEFAPSSLLANTCLLWITPLLTQLCLALLLTTSWAGEWPTYLYWLCQRFLGKCLDLTAEVFLSGVTLLSHFDHWLQLHHGTMGGWIGWWLLTGLVVVKTWQQAHQKPDDTF